MIHCLPCIKPHFAYHKCTGYSQYMGNGSSSAEAHLPADQELCIKKKSDKYIIIIYFVLFALSNKKKDNSPKQKF